MTSANQEMLAAIQARLDHNRANAADPEQRLGRALALADQLKTVEATATSPDRAVTVTAGPGGSIRDIRIGEQSRDLSAQQLSALIMSTLGRALAEAAGRQAAVVQETVGDSAVLDRVLQAQSDLFGTPLPTEAPATAPPADPHGVLPADDAAPSAAPPPAAPPPPPAAPPRPRRRPAPAPEDDDEGDAFQGLGGRSR